MMDHGISTGARASTESPNSGKDHSMPARLAGVFALGVVAVAVLYTVWPQPVVTQREQAMLYNEPGFRPLPVQVRHVDDPHATCLALGARPVPEPYVYKACTDPYGDIVPGQCTVIVPHRAPLFLIEHELLHCERGAYHQ